MINLKRTSRVIITVIVLCSTLMSTWITPMLAQNPTPATPPLIPKSPVQPNPPAGTPPAANSRPKPVIISVGKPNVWSLEQAHYLLARLRSESLALKSTTPTEQELNPNAVNGSRLNSLTTSLDFGASFDPAVRFNNDIAATNTRYNLARRGELENRRDALYEDLDRVTGEIATLKLQRERMNSEKATDDAKKQKDIEIEGVTARQTIIRERITSTNDELGKLTAISSSVSNPSVPDADDKNRLSTSLADKLASAEAKSLKDTLRQDTRLSASTALDNHIGMQYELIAKQLTLLRDEVGPGQRLVFLELPQSIYTTPGKADKTIAQVWWHVDGYVKVDEIASQLTELEKARSALGDQLLPSQPGEYARLVKDIDLRIEDLNRRKTARTVAESQRVIQGGAQHEEQFLEQLNLLKVDQANATTADYRKQARGLSYVSVDPGSAPITSQPGLGFVRTIDLIPRQSSLNVNDIQDTVSTNRFAAAFATLFGIGAKASYQRQRELYEQYLHQEVYASGFGKGESTFGWTFGPLPGTKRLAPGLRTTYAVLVVPDDAQALQLSARSCYFPTEVIAPQNFADTATPAWQQPQLNSRRCDASATFTLLLPGGREESFWVKGVRYRRVRPGERSVVYIEGEDFSAQTGVLVDGVPLKPAVGVAQLGLARTSANIDHDGPISGTYEIVNSKNIVLVFSMPPTYKGTPTISLVAPGRARVLNDLRLRINGVLGRTLDEVDPMIAADAESKVLSITNFDIVKFDNSTSTASAYIAGTKFDDKQDKIFVNTRDVTANKQFRAPGLYELKFTVDPADERLVVTIIHDKEYANRAILNPMYLQIAQATIVRNGLDQTDPFLIIKVEGSGFSRPLHVTADNVARYEASVLSNTEILYKVYKPEPSIILRLTDPLTNRSVASVLARPAAPEPDKPPKKKTKKKAEEEEEESEGP